MCFLLNVEFDYFKSEDRVYLLIMEVGIKTCELVSWKVRMVTCISYLEINRARELVYLQLVGITCLSYLKP